MKKLKVRILHPGRIPFLGGYGPILSPIYLPESQVKHLQQLLGSDKIEIIEEKEIAIEKVVEEVETVSTPPIVDKELKEEEKEEITPVSPIVDEKLEEEEDKETETEEEEVRPRGKKKNRR